MTCSHFCWQGARPKPRQSERYARPLPAAANSAVPSTGWAKASKSTSDWTVCFPELRSRVSVTHPLEMHGFLSILPTTEKQLSRVTGVDVHRPELDQRTSV